MQNGALPHGDAPFRNDSPVNQTGTAEPSAPLWLWALCRTSMRQSSSSKRSCNCCRRTFSSAMRQAPSRQSPLSQRSLKFSADSVMASSRGRSAWPAPGRADRRRPAFRRQLLVDLEVSGRYIVQQQLAEMLEFFGVGRRCLNTAQGIEGLHQLLALMQPAIDQLVHTHRSWALRQLSSMLSSLPSSDVPENHRPLRDALLTHSLRSVGERLCKGRTPALWKARLCPGMTPSRRPYRKIHTDV